MDEKRICDYFVIAGLPTASERTKRKDHNLTNNQSPQHRKYDQHVAPITDITIIIDSLGEEVPDGYECIEKTPTGFQADLNHNSINCETIYLCFRRGTDKPPLTDIGVFYECKDDLMNDSGIIEHSYYGRCGNINNSTSKTYLTYRRSKKDAPCNQLVVTDICVILMNKGETPPHAFNLIQKNLNKGLIGSDVYICYKKSMNSPPALRYTPSIIDRYPLKDLDCYQLPESIPLFCLPLGSTIECWPKENTKVLPLTSTFVLTSNSGSKVYGAALTFYENFQLDELDTLTNAELKKLGYFSGFEQINKKLVVNKAICILSRWPFFELFEGFLNYLYKSVFRSFKKPLNLPVEVYISHFMKMIPFPSIQRPKIRIQLSQLEEDQLTLSNPFDETPLPLSGASYVTYLLTLGPEICMNAFLFALTEQKLLLHSLRLDVLTSVAEALTSLIFPFHFECPYIPLCPLQLCDVLNAPLPFIVGVDSRYFDRSNFDNEIPTDLICIDLDTQAIFMSETKRDLNIKLVPKKAHKNLKKSLENIANRLNIALVEKHKEKPYISFSLLTKKLERQFGIEIQECFLQFMVFILRDFRSYLMPIHKQPSIGSTDLNSLFDFKGFIASKERNYHQFYTLLMNTQMFTRFIEERTFFSDKYTSLAFFDDCLNRIESVESADFSTFKLIELDDRDKNEYCTFISDPESLINGANYDQVYKYNKFGPFNHDLFLEGPILDHTDTCRKTSVDLRPSDDINWFQSSMNNVNSQQNHQQNAASSPMMKRTKHEVRTAQRVAKRLAEAPLTWSKCLISYCYSLWFVHLHSYVRSNEQQSMKAKLKVAFNVLLRMQSLDLHPLDEVCYRILMLLAGIYNQPILAIKILQQMKKHNIVPNALTYGYYNKAVIEGEWKTDTSDENLFWKRLRHIIQVSGHFKRLGKQNAERRLKKEINHDIDKNTDNSGNNVLLDKHDSLFSRQANKLNNSFRGKKLDKNLTLFNEELIQKSSCIVKSDSTYRFNGSMDFSDQAGLLINSEIYQSRLNISKKMFDRKRHKSEETSAERSFNLLKIKEELLNVTRALPTSLMNSRKDFLRSQSLSIYKQENNQDLNVLKSDIEQCKTIFEQHTRTPSTASSQMEQENVTHLTNLNNSSSNDLTGQIFNNNPNRAISKESTNSRRLSELSTNCSDEQISKTTTNLQSMESLDSENSTFSPFRDAIKNINPFLSENKVASSLRSSFRSVKFSFGKSQLANSSFFKYGTSLTRQSSAIEAQSTQTIRNSLPENGISSENLNNNEIKCNMTRSSTMPISVSSAATNDESESSKKSNSSIETESSSVNTVQQKNGSIDSIPKSQTSNDFNYSWTKFNTNRHMDYLNSTIKFASNTMNRLSEIKSSLSNTNSPSKLTTDQQPTNNNALLTNLSQNKSGFFTNIASKVAEKLPTNVPLSEYLNADYYMYDTTDNGTDTTKQSNETVVGDKFFDTLERHYRTSRESAAIQLLKIEITSCSKCYNCMAILYDEEIMAQWTPDDSNLNTTCRYCEKLFVPKLTIRIKYNSKFSQIKNEENLVNINSKDKINEESTFEDYKKFSVAYLTPIVLRKELENIVANEGDFCLTNPQFVLEHDIIYWNLVWYFKRVNLPTHLTGLYLSQFLKERSIDDNSKTVENTNPDFRNVSVICLWDNEEMYEGMPKPLYYFWEKSFNENLETSSLVSALVTDKVDNRNKMLFNSLLDHICNDKLVKAFRFFIHTRKNDKKYRNTKYVYSIYRDLLFLLFAACDRNSIDNITFDRLYRHAYNQLTDEEVKFVRITDKPPSLAAIFCRRSFKNLLLNVGS